MDKERIFVIGLDSVDPDLLENWIECGDLPFFKKLMSEGTYCKIKCIPPTFSPVQWSSILTGTNPGKHGIFGFQKPIHSNGNGGRQKQIYNRTDCKSPTFYDILSQKGKKVGLINMVMTYPASKINGFMITGMETPDLSSPGISYPKGLINELRSIGCNYRISAGVAGLIMQGEIDKAIRSLNQVTDEHIKATKYLMKKYDCDLMTVLFSQIDNCGHYFWQFHDRQHPEYTEKYGDVLLKVYQKHEEVLQELMNEYPDATFIICSDHGMGFNYEARYYLKELFARLGWYASSNESRGDFSLKEALNAKVRNIYWFIYKNVPMRYKRKIAGLFPSLRGRVETIVDGLDWDSSRVYSNDDFFSIYINRNSVDGEDGSTSSGKAFKAFRDEIINKLYSLEEVGTGKSIVKNVLTPDDVYFGDCIDDAPDVIIEWAEVRLKNGIRCGDITILPEEINKSNLETILSGEHRPYGILLMKGKMVQKDQRLADGSIMDIAPTILYLAGQPIPQSMDGKVQSGAFDKAFIKSNPLKYTDVNQEDREEEAFNFSVEESEKIKERLRALGYVE